MSKDVRKSPRCKYIKQPAGLVTISSKEIKSNGRSYCFYSQSSYR